MERSFKGHMKVLSTQGEKLCKVQILALNDAVNRNGWRYVNLEQHVNQFRDIPILTAYVSEGDGIGGGHNFNMKTDEAGEEYASFTAADAERIVGWVPGSAEVKVIRRPDANWIQVAGNLWRWYAREVVDKITSHPEGMDVSIETLVTREHKEPDGTEVEEEYTVLGITVLGNGSRPAVKGAGIRKLNAAREAMKEAVAQAEEYQNESEGTILEERKNAAEVAAVSETEEPRHGDGSSVSSGRQEKPSLQSSKPAAEPQSIYAQAENRNLSWTFPSQEEKPNQTVADRLMNNRGGI